MIKRLLEYIDALGAKYNLEAYQTHGIISVLFFILLAPFFGSLAAATFIVGFYAGREEKDLRTIEKHDYREFFFPLLIAIILWVIF